MTKRIKLRKGLNVNLKGHSEAKTLLLDTAEEYALKPEDFVGMVPKVVVREGDTVKAGDALFVNKNYPDVMFASPVSGTVTAVVRGERRKVLCVKVKADKEQVYVDFKKCSVSGLSAQEIKDKLLKAGLFGYINQLPYAISTNPDTTPKSIFVSAMRDMPLAGDFEYELKGNEEHFQAGLTALSKIARVYLGIGATQTSAALTNAENCEITVFDGPCPAGNVGVHVNHLDPVNKGEVVWTVDPTAVIFFGRLFNTGKVDLTRKVAVAGSEVNEPAYVDCLVGTPVATILKGQIDDVEGKRIINGNPLTGVVSSMEDFVGAHTSEITVIPEGKDVNEFAGWIMPRFKEFSANRSYFSWLFGSKKEYSLDARVKGGERKIIMSGEYDKVLPMDIYGEYLIKAIITGDIDKQEQLGIYEVAPEDFAVAEFVDSSKLELQKIVREGLDILRKENA
jgi:Na+-transporting NADH:ubiquinone oxidoreductase subunit A